MFYVFSKGKTSKLCEILQVTRFRLGKRFFLILQDMLKLVIMVNFRIKYFLENPEIFSFAFKVRRTINFHLYAVKLKYVIQFIMKSIFYIVNKGD